MSATAADKLARRVGAVIGLAAVAVALLSWRIPAASETLGADVRLVATPPGELATEPAGAFASGRALEPGSGAARGSLELSNLAGRRLVVRPRLLPSSRDLDRLLRVRLTARGRTLADGSLGQLRTWSRRGVAVSSGGHARIEARAWLPRRTRRGYAGRSIDVAVELRAVPAGAGP
jgi:hypothetical protein